MDMAAAGNPDLVRYCMGFLLKFHQSFEEDDAVVEEILKKSRALRSATSPRVRDTTSHIYSESLYYAVENGKLKIWICLGRQEDKTTEWREVNPSSCVSKRMQKELCNSYQTVEKYQSYSLWAPTYKSRIKVNVITGLTYKYKDGKKNTKITYRVPIYQYTDQWGGGEIVNIKCNRDITIVVEA